MTTVLLDKNATDPHGRVRTDLNQSTWWMDAHGITHLIVDMEPRWRANCARLLIDRAASLHYRMRHRELWWFPIGVGGGYDDGCPDDLEPYSEREIQRIIRREQSDGDHLDWMRSRAQFLALVAGAERELAAPWHAGVLPAYSLHE